MARGSGKKCFLVAERPFFIYMCFLVNNTILFKRALFNLNALYFI